MIAPHPARRRIGVALVIAAAAAFPGVASASPALHAAPLVPAPGAGKTATANATSVNWSGYSANGGTFTSVAATWTQPRVSCSGSDAWSSFWVGLDGDGSRTVEQTGTAAECHRGSPVYYGWFEMYPAYPVTVSMPVHPGDRIRASVAFTGGTSFRLTLRNVTTGRSFATTRNSRAARRASAEVIAEAPSGRSGVLPLAAFGTVHFSDVTVNRAALAQRSPTRVVMVTQGGTVKASPSAISGGNAFSVTWHHR
jgi:hypothetical protein